MNIDETLSIFPPLESLSLDMLYLCYSLVLASAEATPSDKFGTWSGAVQKIEDAITANITRSVLASEVPTEQEKIARLSEIVQQAKEPEVTIITRAGSAPKE